MMRLYDNRLSGNGYEPRLSDYPAVTHWLARVAAQPGHVPMHPAPEGAVSPGVWRGLRASMAGTPRSPSRMPGVDRSRRGRKFPRTRRSPTIPSRARRGAGAAERG